MVASSSSSSSAAAGSGGSSSGGPDPPMWEWDGKRVESWLLQTLREAARGVAKVAPGDNKDAPKKQPVSIQTVQLWYKNIIQATKAIQFVDVTSQNNNDAIDKDNETDEPPAKRSKSSPGQLIVPQKLHDPCHVWWITKYTEKPKYDDEDLQKQVDMEEDPEDLPSTIGGRLAQFTPGAWLNAMAALHVVSKSNPSTKMVSKGATQLAATVRVPPEFASSSNNKQSAPPAVAYLSNIVWEHAQAMYRLVQAAVQTDIWKTTPHRIQQRLATDLTSAEFTAIRKRIYETVILGKGLHVNDDVDGNDDTAVATMASQVHEVEKYKKCPNCGNMDQSAFALDRKNGDIICSHCGVVVSESLMHEGSAYRKFEGEEDRNHHGDAPNSLYSNAHNLSTSLSGVAPTSGIGGYQKGGGSGSIETILRNTHAYTELNVSQYGKTERRTREGYKDRQKKEAFVQMTHTGDALNLHEAVVQRAKELFAGFRDDRELVQQFKGVLAACLCEAFEQLAAQGNNKQLVKGVGSNATMVDNSGGVDEEMNLTGRAARRNQLHKASMAGKGGLLLDTASLDDKKKVDLKPVAQWNLEDCRSWLLVASRKIAQQWVDDRQAAPASSKHKWPAGTMDELEGQLVEHSIVLCEHLEEELKTHQGEPGVGKRRIVTPRVQDMAKLGIKWQHKHERGSGGKGGLGGSGHKLATAASTGRTAGQVLLRKSAKKLALILKDTKSADAIHKELRSLLTKEEATKRQKLHQEASRQRFQQMQRKPWLQARLQA